MYCAHSNPMQRRAVSFTRTDTLTARDNATWNAAIEAAAEMVAEGDTPTWRAMADELRALKKGQNDD